MVNDACTYLIPHSEMNVLGRRTNPEKLYFVEREIQDKAHKRAYKGQQFVDNIE